MTKEGDRLLTFLEPHAMSRPTEQAGPERRRSPRVPLSIPARVEEYSGREHQGTVIEVGVSGVKVRLATALDRDTVAKVAFTPPDGGPPMTVMSVLVRIDPDGHAFTFVRLESRDAARLRALARAPRRE